jgi:hypothetical protein
MSQQKPIKEQLVGAWTLVTVTAERPDGSKAEPFGNNPKGIIIFTADGHFTLLQSRADVPKLAENDRAKATPDDPSSHDPSRIPKLRHRLAKTPPEFCAFCINFRPRFPAPKMRPVPRTIFGETPSQKKASLSFCIALRHIQPDWLLV